MRNARSFSNVFIFSGLIFISVPVAAMGAPLKGSEITDAIVGHKIHGVTAKGANWNGMYKADGTME
jgi:hypothetical protein